MTATHSPAGTWVLVLKKAPAQAKSRLAAVLGERERQALVESMFQHVLAEVLGAPFHRVAVVSPLRPPLPDGVLWIADRADNLNGSIQQGIDELLTLGAKRILVLPSDLPRVTRGELADLLLASGDCDMVIAPDQCEAGTNALLLARPNRFQPAFGEHSFQKHMDQARRRGLKALVFSRPGLAFDLDDADDWRALQANGSQQVSAGQ